MHLVVMHKWGLDVIDRRDTSIWNPKLALPNFQPIPLMRNPRPKKRYPRSFLRKLQVLTEAKAGIVVAKLLCAAAIEVSMFLSGDIAAEGPAAIGGYAPSFTKKDMSRDSAQIFTVTFWKVSKGFLLSHLNCTFKAGI